MTEITKEYVVKVVAEGLREVVREMKGLNEAGRGVSSSTDEQNTHLRTLDRNLKGTADMTSNSTKAFSKMQQGMQGIVPIYASIAANVFALGAAFRALNRATEFDNLTAAATEFGIRTGNSLLDVANKVRQLTDGTTSLQNSLELVSKATAAGISTDNIEKLTRAAINASTALGANLDDSLKRVFNSVVSLSPELLKTLGITVRLDDATKQYSATMLGNKKNLTDLERQQAVIAKILDETNKKFLDLSDSVATNNLNKLGSTFAGVAQLIFKSINGLIGPAISFFANNITALTALVLVFGSSVLKKTIPTLQRFGVEIGSSLEESVSKAREGFEKLRETEMLYTQNTETLTALRTKQEQERTRLIEAHVARRVALYEAEGKELSKGLQAFQMIPSGTIQQVQKYNQMLNGTNRAIMQGRDVVGQYDTELHKLTAQIEKQEEILALTNRRLIDAEKGYTSVTHSVQRYVAVLKSSASAGMAAVWAGGVSAVSDSWNKGFSALIENILNTDKELKGLSGTMYVVTGATSLFTKTVAGGATLIAKWVPTLAMWYIALTSIVRLLQPITDFFNITSKSSRDLTSTLSSLSDQTDEFGKKLQYYRSNLAELPNTIDNVNTRLEHQINSFKGLDTVLENLIKNLESGGFSEWDKFMDIITGGNVGKISQTTAELQDLTNVLMQSDPSGRIADFIGQYGRFVEDIPTAMLGEFAKLLLEVKNNFQETQQAAIDFNKSIMTGFKNVSDSLTALSNDVPKLSHAETSLANIRAIMYSFDTLQNEGLTRPIEHLAKFSDDALTLLGIQRKELDDINEAINKRLTLEQRLKELQDRTVGPQTRPGTTSVGERDRIAQEIKQIRDSLQADPSSNVLHDMIERTDRGLSQLIQTFNDAANAQKRFDATTGLLNLSMDVAVKTEVDRIAINNKLEQAQSILNSELSKTVQIYLDTANARVAELQADDTANPEERAAALMRQNQLQNQLNELTKGSIQQRQALAKQEFDSLGRLAEQYLKGEISLSAYNAQQQALNASILQRLSIDAEDANIVKRMIADADALRQNNINKVIGDSLNSLTEEYNPLIANLSRYHKELEIIQKAEEKGIGTAQQRAKLLEQVAKRYANAAEPYKTLINSLKEEQRLNKLNAIDRKIEERYLKEKAALMAADPTIKEGDARLDILRQEIALAEDARTAWQKLGESMQEFSDLTLGSANAIRDMSKRGSRDFEALSLVIQGLNTVKGIGAILSQASSGDPYTAVARAAAMATLVASLGVSVGNFIGGKAAPSPRDIQAKQGIGSVLGASDQQSKSLINAMEITAEATSTLVGINTKMHRALERISIGIGSAVDIILRRDTSGGLTTPGNPNTSIGSMIGNLLVPGSGNALENVVNFALDSVLAPLTLGLISSKTINKLVGGKTQGLDSGIRIIADTFSDLTDNVMVEAFNKYRTRRTRWSSWKYREDTEMLEDPIQQQFMLLFQNIGDAVYQAASILGRSDSQIQKAFDTFLIGAIEISLKDLDGKEQADQINAVFSNMFDDLAAHVVPWVTEFQRAGEGMGETLIRIATNMSFVQTVLSRVGQNIAKTAIKELVNLSNIIVEVSGGIESLADNMQEFVSGFFSEEEQVGIMRGDISRALTELNVQLPVSREGFRELVDSIQIVDESTAELYARLLALAGPANQFYTALEKWEESLKDLQKQILKGMRDLDTMIFSHILDPFSFAFLELSYLEEDRLALATEIGYDMVRLEYLNMLERKRMVEDFAQDYLDSLNSLNDFVDSMKLDTLSPLSNKERLDFAQQTYMDTLQLARAGDITASNLLPEVSRNLLDLTQSFFGGTAEYKETWFTIMDELTSIVTDQRDPLVEELEKNSRQSIENTQKIVDQLTSINSGIDELVAQNEQLRDWIALQQSALTV